MADNVTVDVMNENVVKAIGRLEKSTTRLSTINTWLAVFVALLVLVQTSLLTGQIFGWL